MIADAAADAAFTHRMDGARSRLEALSRRARKGESAELRRVTHEFEALFVKIMLDSMRETLGDGGLISKNAGEKLFEDKLYDEYAVKISQNAKLGIAAMMYEQLSAVDSDPRPPAIDPAISGIGD